MKKCNRCAEEKEPEEFYRIRPTGRNSYLQQPCKVCSRELQAERAAADPVRWRLRNWTLQLKAYGLTPAIYEWMLRKQCSRCAICGIDNPARTGHLRFHVDHCHKTGKVRGLLCASCNTGLGRFHDDPDLLKTAIAYLLAA